MENRNTCIRANINTYQCTIGGCTTPHCITSIHESPHTSLATHDRCGTNPFKCVTEQNVPYYTRLTLPHFTSLLCLLSTSKLFYFTFSTYLRFLFSVWLNFFHPLSFDIIWLYLTLFSSCLSFCICSCFHCVRWEDRGGAEGWWRAVRQSAQLQLLSRRKMVSHYVMLCLLCVV